ncbi:hypothetical protein KC799_24490 [candidate division KSB1 bacterium]|nr:hypothetical protein [candidate division KSB1 bacterium]
MKNYIPFLIIPFVYLGVLFFLQKKARLTLLKKWTLFIAMTAFFVTELGRSFYRPFIYENKISDYFIADTIGNSFGTMTAIFFALTISGRDAISDWKIIIMVVLGLVFYELFNVTGDVAIDLNDVIATLLFGAISAGIYFMLFRKYGEQIK